MNTKPNCQLFFERMASGAAIVDDSGRIEDVNEAFCHYFGITKSEVIGRLLAKIVCFSDLNIDAIGKEQEHLKYDRVFQEITAFNGTRKNGLVSVIPLTEDFDHKKTYCLEIQQSDVKNGNAAGINWEYQSLFDYNPEPVFSVDNDGRFTNANRAATLLAGCDLSHLLTKNFAEFCDAGDLICIRDHFGEAQKGSTFNFEVGITNLNGEHRYLNVTNMPMVINNEIQGIYFIAKDITDQRVIKEEKGFVYRLCNIFNTEAGLAECMQLALHEICHHTGIQTGIAWLTKFPDKNLHLIASYPSDTKRFEKETGASVSALLKQALDKKKPAINIFENGPAPGESNQYKALIALPLIFKNEVIAILFFHSSNALQSFNLFRVNENVYVQLAGDIQRKKTEEELNGFFALSSDLLCVAGLDGSFIKINSAFSRLLGYSEQEIMSHNLQHFIYLQDKPVVINLLNKVSAKKPVFEFESRFVCKDGSLLYIAWTFTTVINERLMYGIGRNVSESKRLQKEIESERQRFLNMFSEAPVTMCILKGKEHVFERANELYYLFSGRSNIIGKTVREVFPEAEGQGIFELMDQVYNTASSYSVNERLIQIDARGSGQKEDFYLSFMFQPYWNAEGDVEGIFYFGVDVTEQVKARAKLEESQKLYLDLIQNLPAAVYTCDDKGKILIYNKEAVNLWGRLPDQENDRWCGSWKMYDEDGQFIAHNFSPLARSMKAGKPMKFEELIIERSNGTFRHIASFPSPLFDTSGKLSGGINVLVDITERKKVEVELNKLSLIAKNTINAVLITSPEGHIEWVNDAFSRITGYSYEEVVGKKASDFLHGKKTDPKVVAWMNEKFKNKEAFECELVKYTKGGKTFWMEIQAQPLFDKKGKLVSYFDLETDITDRKNAFEELVKKENEIRTFARQQNNILEEERSRLAREIHDEFGQQLTGIKMSLSSLRNFCTTNHPARELASDLISDVECSIRVLRNIATDLRPGILDTMGLIPSIEWLVKEFEKKNNIQIKLIQKVGRQVFDPELSIVIFRICQEALTNISRHAEADEVIVCITQKRKELALVISDNGKGIKEEKLKDPFSIGLIGMRERASLIGAQLQVKSYRNKGTTIQFTATIND